MDTRVSESEQQWSIRWGRCPSIKSSLQISNSGCSFFKPSAPRGDSLSRQSSKKAPKCDILFSYLLVTVTYLFKIAPLRFPIHFMSLVPYITGACIFTSYHYTQPFTHRRRNLKIITSLLLSINHPITHPMNPVIPMQQPDPSTYRKAAPQIQTCSCCSAVSRQRFFTKWVIQVYHLTLLPVELTQPAVRQNKSFGYFNLVV